MCDPVFFVNSSESSILIRASPMTSCIQNICENLSIYLAALLWKLSHFLYRGRLWVKWSCDYSGFYMDSWVNLNDLFKD